MKIVELNKNEILEVSGATSVDFIKNRIQSFSTFANEHPFAVLATGVVIGVSIGIPLGYALYHPVALSAAQSYAIKACALNPRVTAEALQSAFREMRTWGMVGPSNFAGLVSNIPSP